MSCDPSPTPPESPTTYGNSSLPGFIWKEIDADDTDEALTTEAAWFQKATFWPVRLFNGDGTMTYNNNDVNIGFTNENTPMRLPRVLKPGNGSIVIEAPPGQKFYAPQIYVRGKDGDKVFVEYS